MNAGSIAVDLTLNNSAFNKGIQSNIKAGENAFSKSFNTIKKTAIGTGIAIGVALTASVPSAIKRLDTLKNYENVMSNLGIGADESKASINRLVEGLDGLPTTLDSASSSVQRFTSANGNIAASTEMFLALNNAILAGNTPAETQATAIEQLSQAYSKGKLDMMEWRSAMTAMPAQLKQTALAMGYVNSDALGEALRNGDISMNDFMKTLIKLNKEGVNGFLSFEEQAKNSVGGIGTSITNLKTAFTRGLANIMDAIGQSNIASFFNVLRKGIDAAAGAVVKFINTIASLLSALGVKIPSATTQSSNAIADVGSSALTTSDNISGTGTAAEKAAKKIKGAFSGLDELTTINVSQSSGSDNSGSSDLSSGLDGIGSITTNVGEATEKTGGAFELLYKWIKPLTEINFKPLIDSFGKLKDSLLGLGKTAWAGLEWAYFNILVPLAKWVIEDWFPAWLNNLAGTLNFINPILKAFGQIFIWLWDNALAPIAKFTGGIIVWWLETTGKLLNDIGNWMSDNQSTTTKITAAIVAFFAAWKVTQLMAFIQMSGGLVGAFKSITAAIKSCTIAKLADKVETIKLTLLYAKDFVVSIAQGTAALVKQSAQWVATTAVKVAGTVAITAYTVASGIATAATWAFNAALAVLTSPIFLIVAAIAAVIAIIYLLIKNWDAVKDAALKCWEWIKSIWEGVATWFKQTIIDPIINYYTWLWNSITGIFGAIGTWFKDKFTQAWTAIKNVFSSVGDFFGGIWNTIKSKFSDIGQKIGDAIGGAFKKAINGVFQTIENVVNTPIKLINSLIGVINKIPGINLGKLNTFNLPRLAQGGWVGANSPQLAVVGDNKREGEIISPESKIREQVEIALQNKGLSSGEELELMREQNRLLAQILAKSGTYLDGRELLTAMEKAKDDRGIQTGGGAFRSVR